MSIGWDNYLDEKGRREKAEAERDALRAKLEEKGRIFCENLLMQGEEITRLRAEGERLRAEKTEIIGIVQRWQPAGSPPPGSPQMLVRWICQTLEARAERAEAAHMDLVMQVARKFPGETRHETAKRYILEREATGAGSDRAALAGEKKP